jgi:DNA-directed RNA polymerase subunit K/omega
MSEDLSLPYERSVHMARSIFDREVFFRMEQMSNPFIAARALSQRAREVNSKQKEQEDDETMSAPALALEDYLEGRIEFTNDDDQAAFAD